MRRRNCDNGESTGESHYLQTDDEYAALRWNEPGVSAALWTLTDRLHRHARGRANAGRVVRAMKSLSREVRRVLRRRHAPKRTCRESVYATGCELVSLANVLLRLRVSLDGQRPTPSVLLSVLQKCGLLTLTGYCYVPGHDLLGLCTDGFVQLAAYEDHGRAGVPPLRSPILRGLRRGQVAVVNVHSHERLSMRPRTHYVTIVARIRGDWIMWDPGLAGERSLLGSYKRVFQVWLYRRRPARRSPRR